MYKFLLCWRYLRTRYIALASVISVTLGVATMIVVNAVMSGFAHEMKARIHGILSDVVFESHSSQGMDDPEYHMQQIRRVAGDYIAGMTPTVHVPAMLTFEHAGSHYTRPITLIGIDPETQSDASDFSKYLLHPSNRQKMSFELREGGFDTRDREEGAPENGRRVLSEAGWPRRRWWTSLKKQMDYQQSPNRVAPPELREPGEAAAMDDREDGYSSDRDGGSGESGGDDGRGNAVANGDADGVVRTSMIAEPETVAEPSNDDTTLPGDTDSDVEGSDAADPFATHEPAKVFDPAQRQHTGLVLGINLSSYRTEDNDERFLLQPGDDVRVTFPNAAIPPGAVSDWFTIVDLYESKMSEYDSTFVFVPIDKLQELRGSFDPRTGIGHVNSIQIRLNDEHDAELVRDRLRKAFPDYLYSVSTWRDKQGPLLAAVQMETAILNVLLFLIIAVAGFGILAIFFMIVVEKTRDIGILKSLGASGRGIMGIFLSYGLSLGMVGSGAGLVLGLLFVVYINEIAKLLSAVTGHEVFDPSIYYFYKIPTMIEPLTVAWIACGAMAIAVLASVLPARRAARLHPVEALRHE
jgi:lipoprotein-releasing system permease protein